MRKEKGLPETFFTPSDGFREWRDKSKKGNIECRQLRLDGTLDAASLSEEETVTHPPPSMSFSQAKTKSSTTGLALLQHCLHLLLPTKYLKQ